VILLDANLLIYAYDEASPHHSIAREWLDQQLAGATPVGFPWETITAFLRIVTHPRIYERPVHVAVAWQQIQKWLACEGVWVPQPTERHTALLGEFLLLPGISANLVPDAHLAALAMEHGLTLCSADSGFARFARLRWMNPLAN
jgi:toxin-antitoxin system PIN domain toxin